MRLERNRKGERVGMSAALAALMLMIALPLAAQTTHHAEGTDGDLPARPFNPGDPPLTVFTVVDGDNIWTGTTSSGDKDYWIIDVPTGATLNSVTYSGPIDNGSGNPVGTFEMTGLPTGTTGTGTNGTSSFDVRFDGVTYAPNGGVAGPDQITAGVFFDVIDNPANWTITADVTILPASAPSITTQPTSRKGFDGHFVSFSAAADGLPVPTVQWEVSTDNGANFAAIPGATSTSYSFTASNADNNNQYRAVFTNSGGNATTNAATLTVVPPPTITVDLDPKVILSNSGAMQTITANVNVAGGCNPSFQLDFVFSNDADDGLFPGDQANDIQNAGLGTADISFDLRAELDPANDERVYEVYYALLDDFGFYQSVMKPVVVLSGGGGIVTGGTNSCGATLGPIPDLTGANVSVPYSVTSATTVRMTVYDTQGETIYGELTSVAAGNHTFVWDGTNNAGIFPGTQQPNGFYVVVMETCNGTYRTLDLVRIDRAGP